MVASSLTTVYAYITHAPATHTVYVTVTKATSASTVDPSTIYTSAALTGSFTSEDPSATIHLTSFVTVHHTFTAPIGISSSKSAAAISTSQVHSGLDSTGSVTSPFSYAGSPGNWVLSTSTTQPSYLSIASSQKSLGQLSPSSSAVYSTSASYTTQKVPASTPSISIALEHATSQSVTSSPINYTSTSTILVTEIIFLTAEGSSGFESSDAQTPSTSLIAILAGTSKFSNGTATRAFTNTASIASHGSSMPPGPSTSQGRLPSPTMCGDSGDFTLVVSPPNINNAPGQPHTTSAEPF